MDSVYVASAGVGVGSFFRYFEDMDTLFTAVDEQIQESCGSLFLADDRDGMLEQKIATVWEVLPRLWAL